MKIYCIPESFNTNILHQFLRTFVNSKHENTNLKGDFVLKITVLNICMMKYKSKIYIPISYSDPKL